MGYQPMTSATVAHPGAESGGLLRVGVVEGAIGGVERFACMAALFPHLAFESVGHSWPERPLTYLDILIVTVAASSVLEIDEALRRLAKPVARRVVVVLVDADVTTTRRLIHGGAADVLPFPFTEAALALCLERLLTIGPAEGGNGHDRKPGAVVALLKAGGGVGATALASQVAAQLASRGSGAVCLADFDLQFGAAALYLDLPEAATIADLHSLGSALSETPFAAALATHRSGARVLAAPRDMVALETLESGQIDPLITGLRRDFALTLIDLPSVWNAWTNHVLSLSDRIVLVTHLSVPHIQLVKRQLRVLAAQRLDDRPLILVCNAVTAEQQSSVSIKAAQHALSRPFDIVLPEDRRVMTAAINEGLVLSAVRRGTKLEKAIHQLADVVAADAIASVTVRGRR